MYQNIYYSRKNNQIHLWDDVRGYSKFPYSKDAYIRDSNGSHIALDGKRVSATKTWTDEDVAKGLVYESDVDAEMKTLIRMYGDSDDASVNHRTMFLDIEVLKGDSGYSTVDEAKNTVSAITWYMSNTKEYYTVLLDTKGLVADRTSGNKTLYVFDNEADLLKKFLELHKQHAPTIITGWNTDFFDIPYLKNRISRVLGDNFVKLLSPIGEVSESTDKNKRSKFKLAGISCLDYLTLYKIFTYSEESSYSLDNISFKELKKRKLVYEGDLDTLYSTDIEKFLEYNTLDVQLVVELDAKLDFIDLARGICHKGHVSYENVMYPSKYLDGAAIVYLKRLGIVAPNRPSSKDSDIDTEYEGAYVKPPTPGLYEWVYDLDMTSLYPSIIMSLNVSPETKIGKVEDFDGKEFIKKNSNKTYQGVLSGKHTTISNEELQTLITENAYSIGANGAIYKTAEKGFLPSILETWFDERVEFRKLAKQHHGKDDDKYRYYHKRQLVQKILLNSFYGVLALKSFRFYDIQNAECITLTGQQLIKFTVDMGDYYYNNVCGTTGKEYCIYVDTDSCFFSSLPIIQHRDPEIDLSDESKLTDATLGVATEMQKFLNGSYNMYGLKFHNIKTHKFNIKQEFVAKSGLWLAKKRYAQLLINEEGNNIQPKLDVKGIDVVRSSFPKEFRSFMTTVLLDILNKVNKDTINDNVVAFKDRLNAVDIQNIMLPTGVKDINKWVKPGNKFGDRVKGTPVHVKAALNYNDLLKLNNSVDHMPMTNGDKIKWGYLKPNPYGFDTMGIKGFEDPEEISEFLLQYVDKNKIFESALLGKLQGLYDSMGWGVINLNKNTSKFFG